MLHQHIPYQYVDAIVDRRVPRPWRLLHLVACRAARRAS
jgi:hypothetical protein